jgi:hypothetical protein
MAVFGLGVTAAAYSSLEPFPLAPARRFQFMYKDMHHPKLNDDDPENDASITHKYSDSHRDLFGNYRFYTDRDHLIDAIKDQRKILGYAKEHQYPQNVTNDLLKIFKNGLRINNFESGISLRIVAEINKLFDQLYKLKELKYLTQEEIEAISSNDLLGGIDLNVHGAGPQYLNKLGGKIADKLKDVINMTPRLDGKNEVRGALMSYGSSKLFIKLEERKASRYSSTYDAIDLLIQLLEDAGDLDLDPALNRDDIGKIFSGKEYRDMYWLSGLEYVREH